MYKRRLPAGYVSTPDGKASENENELFQVLSSVETGELPSEDGNVDSLLCIVDALCCFSEDSTQSDAEKTLSEWSEEAENLEAARMTIAISKPSEIVEQVDKVARELRDE